MPKMKTHQGAAGRFVARKNGRLKRRRAGHNHMLEKKSTRQKRRLNTETDVTRSDEKKLKRLLGER
jgi:large subunit ribosomal protein L35